MNAVMTYASTSDKWQRYDAVRRKNAETAYVRQAEYNGENQKKLEELEALLTGEKEFESIQLSQKTGDGQVQQVTIPVGKTLEETIDLWKDVRAEALSVSEPSTADYRIATTASAKIMQTEAQIALENRARAEVEAGVAREEAEAARMANMNLPSQLEREVLILQKRYEQAISSYSFHVQMKRKGFEIERPSFYKIA